MGEEREIECKKERGIERKGGGGMRGGGGREQVKQGE